MFTDKCLEWLIKDWTSPIYVFFNPIPTIEYIKEWCIHVFECTMTCCKGKINGRMVHRYLNTSGKLHWYGTVWHIWHGLACLVPELDFCQMLSEIIITLHISQKIISHPHLFQIARLVLPCQFFRIDNLLINEKQSYSITLLGCYTPSIWVSQLYTQLKRLLHISQ